MNRPRSRSGWIPCLAAVLALAAPAAGRAQSLTSGGLEGSVRSADGSLLGDASVLLTDASGGATRSLEISPGGRFGAAFLPTGSYDVLVERVGYAPRLVRGVVIRPGRRVDLQVTLTPSAPTAERVDTVHLNPGVAGGSGAGSGQWFTRLEVTGLPGERSEIDQLARVTSLAGTGLEVQGLPARMTGVLIDGVPFTPARRPGTADPAGTVAFPLQVLEQAELVTGGADVEWSGSGSGFLSGHTRRGTSDFHVTGFGSWGTGSLDGSDPFGPGSVSHAAMQGGVLLSGPIVRDTASFVLGVEARRFETPLQFGAAFVPAADSLVALAQESHGVALGGENGRLLSTEVLSGFGRLDWQFSDAHALTVRANLASVSAPQEALGAWLGRLGGGSEGLDLSAAATLASQLGPALAQEARAGVVLSRREPSSGTDGAADLLPATSIVAEGLEIGPAGGYAGAFERVTFHAAETLMLRSGDHLFKVGAAVDASRYQGSYLPLGAGELRFSSLGDFGRGQGYFVQPAGTLPTASFTIPRYSGYLQDTWSAAPGLELLLGLRVDADVLPEGEPTLNEEWSTLTGLDNTRIGKTRALLGPRFGLRWGPEGGGWSVQGAGGLYYDAADPAVIGEVLANDGGLRVRRGSGTAADWPGFPQGGTELGPTLTLVAPDYGAPRSARGSLGVSRGLGASMTLHLAAAYRRTELLPRRTDLNLVAAAGATDQHGRPVFGTLQKQGALLFADPGSNRRFSGFDQVFAINSDGWSEYRGATVAFEHRPAAGLTAFGSYTFSSTEDNWVGARSGWADAQLPPLAEGAEGDDWTEGRSDFDVPHRAALGAELRLGGRISPRLAAVYRFRSGYPFTPGFRPGVDANGDGSARNDPAFVDDDVPGFAEVLSGWDCLREQIGRFAERNSCREEGVHSLDARIALDLVRTGGRSASLVVDGLNLLSSDVGETDRALYLVDPAGALQRSAGRVTVPLVANPNFGSPIARYATGRTIRIGFQVSY